MIIDAHTHLFPPEVVADRDAFRARDPWFYETFASPKIRFASPESLLLSMEESNVDHAIVAGWPWRDPGLCAEHNSYLEEVARESGGRLHWMAITNPVYPGAVNHVVDARSNGAVAIGELNADGQGFDWRDHVRLQSFAEVCIATDLPVLLHASEPLGHHYPGKGTATPEKVLALAMAFPELRIVAAHWGGGLPFYELMPEVHAALGNVAYDSAASTYLFRFDVFEVVTRIIGRDRIVFGSDFPVLRMNRFIDRIRETALEPRDLQAMFATNASRIYGIQGNGVNV